MPFLLEFARDPMTVGAIAASSPALVRIATATVPRTGSRVVVELCPGTGAFTEAIQRRLHGRGRHIAVELNARFAQRLAYVHARWAPPARRLLRSLRSQFDEVVVSQTVWANLPPALVYYCRRPKVDGAPREQFEVRDPDRRVDLSVVRLA